MVKRELGRHRGRRGTPRSLPSNAEGDAILDSSSPRNAQSNQERCGWLVRRRSRSTAASSRRTGPPRFAAAGTFAATASSTSSAVRSTVSGSTRTSRPAPSPCPSSPRRSRRGKRNAQSDPSDRDGGSAMSTAGTVVENLDGTRTELFDVECAEATLLALLRDVFEEHWAEVIFGPCIEGAVFEGRFAERPRIALLDGYVTVEVQGSGAWHFHLCIGAHRG